MEREPIVFSGNVLTNGSEGKNKTQMYRVAFKCLAHANISALKDLNKNVLHRKSAASTPCSVLAQFYLYFVSLALHKKVFTFTTYFNSALLP